MAKQIVKFNNSANPDFIRTLRTNVNKYFMDNNLSKYGNMNMYLKTAFMISVYFIPLLFLITGNVSSTGVMYLLWFIMGCGMAGIGLSIMHDANHGAYSKNRKVNAFFGWIVNFLGAYHINWIIQHNVLHHSFTNIEGHDEDISKPVMRFSPNQPPQKKYKYQAYYAPFFYGLLNIYWLLAKDIDQVSRYGKRNLLKAQNRTFKSAFAEILFYKISYIFLTLVLPIIVLDIPWGHILLGFLMMQFVSGMILSLIFQAAHVLEETEFFVQDEDGCVENNFAIHQLKTTSNFANDNKLFSWLIGGLNFQVEHHLFPNICHVHYRAISKIVKKTAKEYGVPYNSHKTYYEALRSHFSLLNKLGRDLPLKPAA
ncbi:MAG: acyl-CoA desaturase [Bacteroidia bacterium]|nr:acyl-CoA desaturase [Bacteroidia bacterium]